MCGKTCVPQAASRAPRRLDPSEKAPTLSELVFASGNCLSREAFQDLARSSTSEGAFFRLFMQTAVGLEQHRAGLLHLISRGEPADPIALLDHWLQAHALGHLAILSFREDVGWFSEMLREVSVTKWTPTHVLVRERIMSIALRGAWAVGQLGESALTLYLPILRSPVEPLEHFNAVLALAMVSLKHPDLASDVRAAIAEWASRESGAGFRKELRRSFALLLDDPGKAQAWSLRWCRALPPVRTAFENRTLGTEEAFGVTEHDFVVFAGMNDPGDCAVLHQGLSPAVLLLSQLESRSAEELYPPSRLIPILMQPWCPESTVDVLRRSVPPAPPSPFS